MGFFDNLFKQVQGDYRIAEAEYQQKLAEGKKKIEAEAGAQLIIDLLASIDRGPMNERILMTSLRVRQDYVRAGLSIWDSLAVKEPQKFTPQRKARMSELLHKAMEEK